MVQRGSCDFSATPIIIPRGQNHKPNTACGRVCKAVTPQREPEAKKPMAAGNTGGGVFTPEELIGWLRGVKPAPRTNLAHVPKPGSTAMEMRKRAAAALEEAERRERGEGQFQGEEEEEEEEGEEEYRPYYNFTPDDASGFDNVDGYDPGNLPNPNAQPGDYDYEVNQSGQVYEDFSFDKDTNPRLPIHQFKRLILDTIASVKVTALCCKVQPWHLPCASSTIISD